MQARSLGEAGGQRQFVLVFQTGERVMAGLAAFAAQQGLDAARLVAIGAFERAELAFFDWRTKDYRPIPVEEQTEVASMNGDIALDADGKLAVHVHVVLGRQDGQAVAGHLVEATVRPTLEVMIEDAPTTLKKRLDPESGLMLIRPTL